MKLDPARPTTFPLRLCVPLWAQNSKVSVNGQALGTEARPGTFLEVKRRWTSGDEVTLELQMKWRLVKGRERQAGMMAVMIVVNIIGLFVAWLALGKMSEKDYKSAALFALISAFLAPIDIIVLIGAILLFVSPEAKKSK